MRLSSRLAFDALLLAAVLGGAVLALSYERRAGTIPFIVAVLGAVLVGVQGWIDLRRGSDEGADGDGHGDVPGWRWPAAVVAALIGFVFLVWLVGYLIAVPVFTYAALVLLGRTGWKPALAVTAGLWAFVYLLLEVLLRANLS